MSGRTHDRSGTLGLAALGWALALVLIQVLPALANHDPNDFWDGLEWWEDDRGTTRQYYEFTEQVPGGANTPFADRVAEGAQQWNAIAISGPDNHFVRNGVVGNYDPFQGTCSDLPDWQNGVHYRDIPDNPYAWATVCRDSSIGTDRIRWFQVVFDPNSTSWYTGESEAGIGSSQRDVEASSAHEFGHVVGGWLDSSNLQHFQSPRDGTVCSAGYNNRHTMCGGGDWPNGANNPKRRTLETHDVQVYVDRYAPG